MTELDIKERVKIYQSLLNKSPTKFHNIKLAGYNIKSIQRSKLKNRTFYLIKPPFSYNKRNKYNFKFNNSYFDLFKRNNYYSFFYITDFKSDRRDFFIESLSEVIKEFCCTKYYTYAYLWIRTIIESLIARGYKIKVIESPVEFNSVIFDPLLSDLESEDPNLTINLSWYPKKCEINENILNLSIFNLYRKLI